MKSIFVIGFLWLGMSISACRDKDDSNTVPAADSIIAFDWQPDTVISDSILFAINSDFPNVVFRKVAVYAGSSPSGGAYYNYFIQAAAMDAAVSVSPGQEVDPNQQSWNCLDSGTVVDNHLTWLDHFDIRGNVIMAGGIGIWDRNPSYGYIGIRVSANGKVTYGWFRLTAIPTWYLALDAYAYNATAGRTIRAGQSR